jgi:cytochrome P450 family 110
MPMNADRTSLPPGPSAPAVVNLARWVGRPFEYLEDCTARYGDYFTVHLPAMPPNVVFSDPVAVRDLFTAPVDEVTVAEIAGVLKPVMGARSVMMIDGEPHRRERRRMMPPFRGGSVRTYGPTISESARAMIDRWREGERIEVLRELHAVTLDIIVRITLGPRTEERRAHLCEVVERFLEHGTSPLATAILTLTPQAHVERLFYTPVRSGGAFAGVLPWAHIVRAQEKMDEMIADEISLRRTTRLYDGADDLLSLLMTAKGEDGRPMSDACLRDQIVTLLLAGHETTANTLTWTVAHLLEAPEAFDRVRADLGGEIDLDRIDEDPFLDAILRESMRLSPVVPTVGRHLKTPRRIGRCELPAGVNAIACAYLVQRRADLFPEPTRFRPERWLEDVSPYHFFPFGGGARRCLGMALAYFEMKVVLAEIARAVDLDREIPRLPRPVRKSVTFAPERGLPVRVRKRSRARHGTSASTWSRA